MIESLTVRRADDADLAAVRRIYNEGIEDRVATLETDPKGVGDIAEWWSQHDGRHIDVVAMEKLLGAFA